VGTPEISTVVRTLWRIKDDKKPPGSGENAKPDLQQLVTQCDVVIWCDSSDEDGDGLEARVHHALRSPESVSRFGGWSLGESTHLVNDLHLLEDARPPKDARVFLLDACGTMTLPVWVDHVGTAATRYAVGRLARLNAAPLPEQLPQIESDG